MSTLELNPSVELVKEEVAEKKDSLYQRFNAFIDSQAPNRIGWFMGSLLWQGVLCLPVPAFLMYYYHAPIWVLIVTVSLFFANLVVGMVGTKTKDVIGLLAAGTLVHLAMILMFVL